MSRLHDEGFWQSFPSESEPYRPGPPSEPVVPKLVTDWDGKEVAVVPVRYSRRKLTAKLFPRDWEALQRIGISEHWRLHVSRHGTVIYPYVVAYFGPPNYCTKPVSRLITQPGPSLCVKYWDGNPLNLRRDNLRVTDARR